MKFIKKIRKQVTLATLTILGLAHIGSYASNVCNQDEKHSVSGAKIIGVSIMKCEPLIGEFFNVNSTISHNEVVIKSTHLMDELHKKLDSISPAGPLSTKSLAIAREVLTYFAAPFGVIKQYNGKSADHVLNFITDLNRVFDPEKAFSTISSKLQVLLKDAEAAQADELIAAITDLLQVIQRKRVEWNKKNPMSLMAGLRKRMGGK